MAFKIPTPHSVPHFNLACDLDGETFGLEFRWNHVAEQWKLTISDGEGVVLVSGLSVVVRWPIARRFADTRLFKGVLQAVDTTGKDRDPGLDDLGERVELRYYPEA